MNATPTNSSSSKANQQ